MMNRERDDFNIEIGQRLQAFRLQAGYTQQEMADLVGLKEGKTYGQYETGFAAIPHRRLKAFCEALGLTPNDIYGFSRPQVRRIDVAKRMLENSGITYHDAGKQQISIPLAQLQDYDFLPADFNMDLWLSEKKLRDLKESYVHGSHEDILRLVNIASEQAAKEIEYEKRSVFRIKFKYQLCRLLAFEAFKKILADFEHFRNMLKSVPKTVSVKDGDNE